MNSKLYKDIVDEIRNVFTIISTENGYYQLVNLPAEYDGYVVKRDNQIGVGIPISKKYKDFSYFFENISIVVIEKMKNGNFSYFLELLASNEVNLNNFSIICAEFVMPGDNGEIRNKIINDPQKWIDDWKEMIGNKIEEETFIDKVGELIVLKLIYGNDKSAVLTKNGSHDIETLNCNYEVKTTKSRYGTAIEIHNKYQLSSLNGNPLYLYFVRLETSISGVSINSLINDLEISGYNVENLKKSFSKINSETKNQYYKIDEIREYYVDDEFPKIIDNSFVNGTLPEHITEIRYTIDLDGIEYKQIEINN